MSLNPRMDKENVVYLHNAVLHSRKNNDILKFVNKWMDLENLVFVVSGLRKTISYVFTHKWLLDTQKISLQFTILDNLDNKEDPKRDIHGSNQHGK